MSTTDDLSKDAARAASTGSIGKAAVPGRHAYEKPVVHAESIGFPALCASAGSGGQVTPPGPGGDCPPGFPC